MLEDAWLDKQHKISYLSIKDEWDSIRIADKVTNDLEHPFFGKKYKVD